MKRLSDKEIEQHMKRALGEAQEVKPKTPAETQWRKIKSAEKRKKRLHRLRQIPVYASSFIAVVALGFFVIELPSTGEETIFPNEERLAGIERAYEGIQEATMMVKETAPDASSLYPTYLPENYTLVKEEWVADNRMLHYEGGGHAFTIEVVTGEEERLKSNRGIVLNELERTVEGITIRITGDLTEDELVKIIESM